MDAIALEAKESMGKTIKNLEFELLKLRTGRASPAMLTGIQCEYYGDKIDISSISSVSCPEPRQLLIKPYDKGDVKSIVTAIHAANIGVNPINEGDQIRITIAPLTEETRRELVKRGKAIAEENKIAIRNIRREFVELVKDSDEYTEDMEHQILDEIQEVTDDCVKEIDELFKKKESEIMAI